MVESKRLYSYLVKLKRGKANEHLRKVTESQVETSEVMSRPMVLTV